MYGPYHDQCPSIWTVRNVYFGKTISVLKEETGGLLFNLSSFLLETTSSTSCCSSSRTTYRLSSDLTHFDCKN